jgi:hypothetical protein
MAVNNALSSAASHLVLHGAYIPQSPEDPAAFNKLLLLKSAILIDLGIY